MPTTPSPGQTPGFQYWGLSPGTAPAGGAGVTNSKFSGIAQRVKSAGRGLQARARSGVGNSSLQSQFTQNLRARGLYQKVPAGGAGGASGAAASQAWWAATPASAGPVATGAVVVTGGAIGLGVGNKIYEDVLNRPWGPSLGDYLSPQERPQRDGPTEAYEVPGESLYYGGQDNTVYDWVLRYRIVYDDPQFTDRDSFAAARSSGPFGGVTFESNANGVQRISISATGGGQPAVGWDSIYPGHLEFISFEPTRADGQPDNSGSGPAAQPETVNPTAPYRSSVAPQIQTQPSPRTEVYPQLQQAPQPSAPQPQSIPTPSPRPGRPTQPQPNPSRQPDESPYEENRPAATGPAAPRSLPPLIPGLAQTPRARRTLQPGLQPQPTTPRPSTKQKPGCGCSPGILAGVAKNLNPIAANVGAEGASTAAILAKLGTMQTFAEKAWKATRLDKAMQALTLFTVLHNGAHLSRNLAETLGDVLSNGLAVVGLKDENDNRIDVNEVVGSTVSNWLKSLVGEEIYTSTKERWLKLNRVYQATANIAFTMRSLFDSTQEIASFAAENTGKIGNALKKAGVVFESAYKWLPERVRPQDTASLKFQRVLDGLDAAEDFAGSLQNVTGEVLEVQEQVTELTTQRQEFKTSLKDLAPVRLSTHKPET